MSNYLIQTDTFNIVGDTLIRNRKTEIYCREIGIKRDKRLLNRDWSQWQEKNGK
jgi:hypothetical protein